MKKYKIPLILLWLSILCLLIYKTIGSHVDANGVLVEQFWLLPVADLLWAVWIVWAIVVFVKSLFKKK